MSDVVPGDPRWGLGRSTRSSGYRSRTYYLPDDLHFRIRNAWWHTQTEPDGHDSISELVAFALLPVVEELEASPQLRPPVPRDPGAATAQGRPVGEGPAGSGAQGTRSRAARDVARGARGRERVHEVT